MNHGNILSIDLGSKNIHILEGRYVEKGIKIVRMAETMTPSDSFADGRILNSDALKAAIRSALLQEGIKSANAVLTIQSTAVITREFLLPAVRQEEFDNMVKYEIERFLPIVESDYIVQYKLLDEAMEDNIKKWRVQAAAMPRGMARECFSLLKELRLKPVALDIHSNAVSKLFSEDQIINGQKCSPDNTVAVLDIGYSQTGINIVSKGKTEFCRTLMFGGKNIDLEISKCLKSTIEEAEKWKLNNFSAGSTIPAEIHASVDQILDSWVGEVQKVILYFTNRSASNKVKKIYLCGGSSLLNGLPQYLERHLGIPAECISELSSVSVNNMSENNVKMRNINCIGGMIRC